MVKKFPSKGAVEEFLEYFGNMIDHKTGHVSSFSSLSQISVESSCPPLQIFCDREEIII